jgi:hypothetical protein
MAGWNDTHPEAEQVLREVYRKMSFAAKRRQMGIIYRTALTLHAAGVRSRKPAATEEMIQEDWWIISLGPELVQKVKEAMSSKNRRESDL